MNKQLIKERENEPNFLQFIDEETNYQCFIFRNEDFGYLCGYVQIPKNNKLYKNKLEAIEQLDFEVHGGVTFTNDLFRVINAAFDFDDAYGVGFDCAHATDIMPYQTETQKTLLDILEKMLNCEIIDSEISEYRNIEYVTNECKKLAKQLKTYE